MIARISCVVVLLLAASYAPAQTPRPGAPDLKPASQPARILTAEELYRQASPAVVTIRTDKGQGSGFLVSSDGLIVTNYHVVYGTKTAEVELSTKAKLPVTGIVATEPRMDLAILKVNANNAPFLKLASSLPAVGAKAYAIGSPMGFTSTLSEGIISSLRTNPSKSVALLQTTASISPGSSGGPLLSADGSVVGVNSMTYSGAQNINFAISSINVLGLLANRKEPQPLAGTQWGPRVRLQDPQRADLPPIEGIASLLDAAPREMYPPKLSKAWDKLTVTLFNDWAAKAVALRELRLDVTWAKPAVVKQHYVIVMFDEPVAKDRQPYRVMTFAFFSLDEAKSLTQLKPGQKISLTGVIGKVELTLGQEMLLPTDEGKQQRPVTVGTPARPAILVALLDARVQVPKGPATRPSSYPSGASTGDEGAGLLGVARAYRDSGMKDKAAIGYKDIIARFPNTKAAQTAQEELRQLYSTGQ